MKSPTSLSVTSSPVLAVGPSPSKSQGGQLMLPFGPEVVPASHSARQESEKERLTNGTCGQSGSGSSASAGLSASLANKLKERLAKGGSTLYLETWKEKVTPAGRLYWAHTASARRTSDSDCSGWPTATVGDSKNTCNATADRTNADSKHHAGVTLVDAAKMAGWPTAAARDWRDGRQPKRRMATRDLGRSREQ